MSQIQQEYQNYISNPLNYFANTPRSIQRRKHQATRLSNMKIVDFTQNPHNNSFNVLIKGHRGITYQLFFSESSITCSCPDYEKHSVKPICKHMFKLICLSENHDIVNNSMLLTDLMKPQHLERILTSTLRIIDIKKMEKYGGPQNQISIERDDYCSICYGDFDADIAECLKCKHVFHQNCIRLSWSSASYLSRGKCPMCREPNSFPQFGGFNNNDPWEIYNFPPPPVSAPEAVPEAVPEAELVNIVIGNPNQQLIEELVPELVQHDILLVNPDENVLDNQIIPEQQEQNDDVISQNQLFFQLSDDISGSFENGEEPNEDPNQNSENQQILGESAASLSQEEGYDIIDRRIKILNISFFILNTINIIINQISSNSSSDPKPE